MSHLTQQDIARRVGVSRKAIAFALSGDPTLNRKLSSTTRRRILKTVQRLGYVPHDAARRLARARVARGQLEHVVLVCAVPAVELGDPVCFAMMSGAEYELSGAHASVTFVRVAQASDWRKVRRMARAGSVDGWLLYGPIDDAALEALEPGELPYVILGAHRCRRPVPSVDIDNGAIGRLAAKHLAALGHRRIGYLYGGTMAYCYQRQSLEGFRAEAAQRGVENDPRLTMRQDVWFGQDPAPALRWLRDTRPSALFAAEFNAAAAVTRVCNYAHIKIPEQLSILACESVTGATLAQNLTRVELPMGEVGRQGARLLRELASQTPVDSPRQVLVPPVLVNGWSTCVRNPDQPAIPNVSNSGGAV